MPRTWTTEQAAAPGTIALADGTVLRLERPSVGRIPHVFADITADEREHRRLIELRHVVRLGDVLFTIVGLEEDAVTYRTSHVHDDARPLLRWRDRRAERPALA